tara:strand:- start:1756 stop:2160 length:405 start_codon:yes stop_codon:yes gene_type:complete
MATVKGILVNDGGAPGRIMNFNADATIYAGDTIELTATGCKAADEGDLQAAGVALVDAAADEPCSVITGSGLMLNAAVDGSGTPAAIGSVLGIGENGTLIVVAAGAAGAMAVALEAKTTAPGTTTRLLSKVLVL